jgi:hypothetical protein
MAPQGYDIPQYFTPTLDYIAEEEGIDPNLLSRVIKQESNFNPFAVSSAGAQGLGQLMPGTAAELGVEDPFDPVQNAFGSARYLKQQLDTFGNEADALSAYNWGPGNTKQWLSKGGDVAALPEETRDYRAKILGETLPTGPRFASNSYSGVMSDVPTFSKRREANLDRVSSDISTLEGQRQEALEALKNQGQLDTSEAIGIALTAILPTLLGFGFGGGLQGAAVGSQAGAAGANAGIQGLTQQMNRRDEINKVILNNTQQQIAAREAERRGIEGEMATAEEMGQRQKFNADALTDRTLLRPGGRGNSDTPLTREQAEVMQKQANGVPLTVEDRLVLGTINPYKLQTNLYGTGANAKPIGESSLEKMSAGVGAKASIANAKQFATEFEPGIMSALRAGKITDWYKNPDDPAYKFYAEVAKLKKEVARMNDSGALSQPDVEMFAPLVEGSPVYDSPEAIQERLTALEKYIDTKRNAILTANKMGGRNTFGLTQNIEPSTGSGAGGVLSFEEWKKAKAEGRL